MAPYGSLIVFSWPLCFCMAFVRFPKRPSRGPRGREDEDPSHPAEVVRYGINEAVLDHEPDFAPVRVGKGSIPGSKARCRK